MTATTLETTVTTAPRRGAGRGRERAVRAALLACTVVGLAVLAALLLDVAVAGVPRLDLDFLSSYPSRHPEATGILAGLTGTLSLLVLVVALAVPVGIGAALYLEELAPPAATGWSARLARVAELNIANLAGVPSVVFGLLGSTLFVYWLGFGRNLLAGAATLALLVLPVVIVASREALRAVPQATREAGLALGATRWQVVRSAVLPAARPGIATGTVLAVSRAIGETAPLLLVGGLASARFASAPWEPFAPFSALPVQILGFVQRPQPAFREEAAAAAIVVLMVVLLAANAVAVVLRARARRSL